MAQGPLTKQEMMQVFGAAQRGYSENADKIQGPPMQVKRNMLEGYQNSMRREWTKSMGDNNALRADGVAPIIFEEDGLSIAPY